jgi:hypothetical protein
VANLVARTLFTLAACFPAPVSDVQAILEYRGLYHHPGKREHPFAILKIATYTITTDMM